MKTHVNETTDVRTQKELNQAIKAGKKGIRLRGKGYFVVRDCKVHAYDEVTVTVLSPDVTVWVGGNRAEVEEIVSGCTIRRVLPKPIIPSSVGR